MHYIDITIRAKLTDYRPLYDMFTKLGYKEHAVRIIPPEELAKDTPAVAAVKPKIYRRVYNGQHRMTAGKASAIKKYAEANPTDTLNQLRDGLAKINIKVGASTISHVRNGTYDKLIKMGDL